MEAKLDNKVEVELKYKPKKKNNELIYIILTILSIAFLAPIFIVLYNIILNYYTYLSNAIYVTII